MNQPAGFRSRPAYRAALLREYRAAVESFDAEAPEHFATREQFDAWAQVRAERARALAATRPPCPTHGGFLCPCDVRGGVCFTHQQPASVCDTE